MPQNRTAESNKRNKGQHSRENKRKMVKKKEDAWTTIM